MEDTERWNLARLEVDLGGVKLLAFHGSPASNRQVIGADTPEAELEALRGSSAATLLAGGTRTARRCARSRAGRC
ncbi:hypothetical protein HNR42_001832 [Deinobacterium chartae]|uniref:Uncharacterized protein n=1 Tax=Deinobacterium chartae TaxID=521158 RepID=A0A841I238_9DEIO|nr:hypothetical protein [Deinobacterium chartae]MBB6098398.1 hypothetical protein [Deinobacterium chartae]